MKLISLILEIFGIGWMFLIIMIAILGGRVLVQIENPITKNMENITDILIDHSNEKKPG